MRTRWGSWLVAIIAAVTVIPAAAQETTSGKPRVVSLDYCADQYVLALADRDQIIALSPAATSDYSYHADKAAGLPVIRATVEEVLLRAPDVVVRQWGGGLGATPLLEDFGISVAQIEGGDDVDSVRRTLRQIGDALGQRGRAEGLIAAMDARLAARSLQTAGTPRALYVTAGGATTGAGTFIDYIITTAGLKNMGAEQGRTGWAMVDLERMVLDPPDVIIGGFFDLQANQARHWALSRHSVLRQMMDERVTVQLPSDVIACSAWFFVDAVDRIDEMLATRPVTAADMRD